MNSIPLALGAAFGWGFADYAGGVASRSLRWPVVLCLSQLAGFLVVTPVALLSGTPSLSAGELAAALVAGGIAVFSLGFMFRAMAVGAISIVGPISACGVAIPVVVGLVAGERPAALQLAGVALAVTGVVLVSVEHGGGGQRRLVAGAGLALGSAVCVGAWFVVIDAAAVHDPYWAAFFARSATASIITVVALAQRRPWGWRAAEPRVRRLVAGSGLADAGAEVSYTVATSAGLMSIAAPLASLYPAVMVGLGALVLHERLGGRQAAGLAAALAGILLISAG